MAHVILDKQQNSGLVAHLRRIANGSVKVKEADSPLVLHLKSILDGKAAPAGQQAEKGTPPLAPSYGMGGVLPIYGGPDPTKEKEKKGTPSIITRFFDMNQNYGRKQ